MMRNVYLYGRLARKFGKHIRLEVTTAAEAVRALMVNFKDFEKEIRKGSYHVVRGKDLDNGLSLDETEVSEFKLGTGDLHIAPFVKGSKRGGILKIILGVALAGAALFMGIGAPFLGGLGVGATWGNVAMLGVALAAAGVSQLLAPEEEDQKKNDSFTMSGPINIYEQGYPIPLVYGRVITGTLLVSGSVDIEDIAA